jgi:hypothetical protein
MKKTISYKVAQPPLGINGGNALGNTTNGQVFENKVYIPYGNPFLEARCIYLGVEGAVLALATPKDDGTGITYRLCAANAQLGQQFRLRGEFTKVMDGSNPALAKYIDQLTQAYDPLNQTPIAHSIYTKAGVLIDKSLSKAIASDESEIIDFQYEINYYPSVLDKYSTLSGKWFDTKNGEFYNPFLNNEAGGMQNIYFSPLPGVASRQGQNDSTAIQAPDGSFISFWPVDTDDLKNSGYPYNAIGLANLREDGINTLLSNNDAQGVIYEEEYAAE